MLLALTAGQKLGIGLVAAAFIAFALVASFLLPRRDPNFPGRRMPLFVIASVLFFAGMMTAMVTLAREPEGEAHGSPETQTAPTGTTTGGPGETEPATTAGETETDAGDDEAVAGDPAAGREVFAAQCGSCHTLQEAGTSGTIGPSLDDAELAAEPAERQIREGGGGMPPFEGRLSDEEIQNVTAFVVEASAP
ncbi:MAG: cytochrome c [Thermoleophilia bacterium]|nr:cytochrome c [Thermoleophilia bacterium]